jgi:hypothetical protein
MSSDSPVPAQFCSEERTSLLHRRSELYRVCLRERIGAATSAEYFREVIAAEAELACLRGTQKPSGCEQIVF